MPQSSIRFTPKILSISHASDLKSNQFGTMTIAIPREILGDDLSLDTLSRYTFEVIVTPSETIGTINQFRKHFEVNKRTDCDGLVINRRCTKCGERYISD